MSAHTCWDTRLVVVRASSEPERVLLNLVFLWDGCTCV
jgi:hypothetical protein